MKTITKILTTSLAALSLAACASVTRLDAAGDVHALLISIRDNDHQAFDAHVDRLALQQQIETQLATRTGKNEKVRAIAALLGPSLARMAGDMLVQPEVFRFVAEEYGYGPEAKIPPSIGIASMLKELPDGRVCATRKKGGDCLLIFTKEDGGWKLTSFQGDVSELRLKG